MPALCCVCAQIQYYSSSLENVHSGRGTQNVSNKFRRCFLYISAHLCISDLWTVFIIFFMKKKNIFASTATENTFLKVFSTILL